MEAPRELQKKYGTTVMFIAIVLWIVFYILGMPAVGRGFLLGSLASVINFALMGEFLARRFGLKGRKLKINIYGSLIIRLLIMAGALYLGIKDSERFNTFAVIAGLFMVQIMILAHHLKTALFPGNS